MAVSWFAVVALATTALGASIERNVTTLTAENQLPERHPCGRVWVTIHSPTLNLGGNNRVLDAVELNWNFRGCPVPRQIGLFRNRPASWNNALALFRINAATGFTVTRISLGDGALPAGWQQGPGARGSHCLWPWVGAGGDTIQFLNCLKIQPTWMADVGPWINRLRIGDLAIAGTHNAGAWRFDTELSNVARDSFVLCQDRSIWAQLVYGIRYFDFRIAFYNSGYWLNHNLIRVRPLLPLLREIRRFLDATNEVVFLDAHHFPVGFYNSNNSPIWSVHNGLLQMIQRELGPHIAPHNQFGTGAGTRGPTLQTLLNARRRLVFSYIDNAVVNANNWLWPRLPHLWANTNNPTTLFRFLDQAIDNSPQPNARMPLHSAMAQTTPTAMDIVLLRGSIRENANRVNRDVTERLSTRWRVRANIVSTDFFLGTDVVDLSIDISVERWQRGRMQDPSGLPLARALAGTPQELLAAVYNTTDINAITNN